MADPEINVLIKATADSLLNELKAAGEAIRSLTEPVAEVTKALGGFSEVLLGAFAVDKISEWVSEIGEAINKTVEAGAQIDHLSQELGISADQMSEFAYAAGSMGVSVEAASRAMTLLERSMANASSSVSLAGAAFESLGISVKDPDGELKSLNEILPEIANKFAESADGPAKTAIAYQLLGRAGAQMIPLLNKGADGLAELNRIAQDTGTVLSDETAKAFEETSTSTYELQKSMEGIGITIVEKLNPALTGANLLMAHFYEALNKILTQSSQAREIEVLEGRIKSLQDRLELFKEGKQTWLDWALSGHDAIADITKQIGLLENRIKELRGLSTTGGEARTKDDAYQKPKLKTPAEIRAEQANDEAKIDGEKKTQDELTKAVESGELDRAAFEKQAAEGRLKLGLATQAETTAVLKTNEEAKYQTTKDANERLNEIAQKAFDDKIALAHKEGAEGKVITKLEADKLAAQEDYTKRSNAAEAAHTLELGRIIDQGAQAQQALNKKYQEDRITAETTTGQAVAAARMKAGLAANAESKKVIENDLALGKISGPEETARLVANENEKLAITKTGEEAIFQAKLQGLTKERSQAKSEGEKGAADVVALTGKIKALTSAHYGEMEALRAKNAETIASITTSGATKDAEATRSEYERQIAAANATYARETAAAKQAYAEGHKTIQQETTDLLTALQTRETAIAGYYDKIAHLGGRSQQQAKVDEDAATRAALAGEQEKARIISDGEQRIAKDQMKSLEDRIKSVRAESEQEIDAIKLKGIQAGSSEETITAAVQDAAIRRYGIIDNLYAQIAAIRNLDAADVQKAEDNQVRTIEESNRRIVADQLRAAEETKHAWDAVGSEIGHAFAPAITGLIEGTMTWKQAYVRVLDSLLQDFINWGVESVAEFAATQLRILFLQIVGGQERVAASAEEGTMIGGTYVATEATHGTVEATKTAATIAGTGVRESAEITAVGVGEAASTTAATSQITKDAAVAAAGTWAGVSSIPFGWIIAPALAAGALAAVLHFAGAFEQGTDFVPQTGLAMVHQGEMVIAKDMADVLRSSTSSGTAPIGSGLAAQFGGGPAAAGGGGGSAGGTVTVNFTVKALDSRDVVAMFKSNGAQLANIMGQQMRNSPQQMTNTTKQLAGPAY